MPLQNRVSPFGIIHAVPDRGTVMGNRGIIHDHKSKTLLTKRWSHKAWIICACEFRGRHRQIMAENRWTELFFLDDVTALAAGHRPCFQCRYRDAVSYANAASSAGGKRASAAHMDKSLHMQRTLKNEQTKIQWDDIFSLPDGAMITANDQPFAKFKNHFLKWTFSGYETSLTKELIQHQNFHLLTPAFTCQALSNGYRPQWHESARQITNS